MLFLLVIAGLIILCLIVFGGGQVFMPLFKSFWELLDKHGANLTFGKSGQTTGDVIDNVFTLSNSTPGVTSTKFAAFTGYLVSNGQWWGYLAFIGAFLVFAIPSIVMVVMGYKLLKKSQKHKYLAKISLYMMPVIAGTMLALAIQLFIGTALPQVVFNSDGTMFGVDTTGHKAKFLSGWRMWVALAYTIIVPFEVFYFSVKKKINIFYLILIHAIIGVLILAPWAY